jgi:hypothetical protein
MLKFVDVDPLLSRQEKMIGGIVLDVQTRVWASRDRHCNTPFAIEHGMVKSCQASNTSSFTMHDTAA